MLFCSPYLQAPPRSILEDCASLAAANRGSWIPGSSTGKVFMCCVPAQSELRQTSAATQPQTSPPCQRLERQPPDAQSAASPAFVPTLSLFRVRDGDASASTGGRVGSAGQLRLHQPKLVQSSARAPRSRCATPMLRCSSVGRAPQPERVAFPQASSFFNFKESLRLCNTLSGEDPPASEEERDEASTRAAAQRALAALLAKDKVMGASEGPLDRALRTIRTPRPPVTGTGMRQELSQLHTTLPAAPQKDLLKALAHGSHWHEKVLHEHDARKISSAGCQHRERAQAQAHSIGRLGIVYKAKWKGE